jgi:hypothetical protein
MWLRHTREEAYCPKQITSSLFLKLTSNPQDRRAYFSSPFPPPSSGGKSGDVGEDCLSTWTRSGSCEFRSRLTCRATQGTSKRWRIGDRLLLVTFGSDVTLFASLKGKSPPKLRCLGEARKVTSRRLPRQTSFLHRNINISVRAPTERSCCRFSGLQKQPTPCEVPPLPRRERGQSANSKLSCTILNIPFSSGLPDSTSIRHFPARALASLSIFSVRFNPHVC